MSAMMKLPDEARAMILDEDNEIYYSAASVCDYPRLEQNELELKELDFQSFVLKLDRIET